MKVLFATLCLVATALAVDIEGGPALIETFSKHLDGRISGGDEEHLGSFPYQVALMDDTGSLLCSGVIISDDWVLTAGHCVDQNRGRIDVRAGITKLDANNGVNVTTTAADRTIHKNFEMDFLDNDIALIKLPTKLTFNKQIDAVGLPTYADAAASLAEKTVAIAGWGNAAEGAQANSVALKSATITLPDNKICEDAYRNVMIGTKGCASTSENPKSVCTGDSGAPVVERTRPTDILHGILSFGSKDGCAAKKPVVFTRISSFFDFIEETTGIHIADNPSNE